MLRSRLWGILITLCLHLTLMIPFQSLTPSLDVIPRRRSLQQPQRWKLLWKKDQSEKSEMKGQINSLAQLKPRNNVPSFYKSTGSNQPNILDKVYQQIDQNLNYPALFIQEEIQGMVNVTIFFSKDGHYLEGQTRYSSNSNFLKVHVARCFRKSFHVNSLALKKILVEQKIKSLNALFIFHLSTGLPPKVGNISNEKMVFSRHAYGGSKGIDKFNKKFFKTLGAITNILSLLELRPEGWRSDKERVKRMLRQYQWQNYKNDSAWNQ